MKLPPINLFLMEVKTPTMTLALEGMGNVCARTKRYDLPVRLKKLTLAIKAVWVAREGGLWAHLLTS